MVTKMLMYAAIAIVGMGAFWWYTDPVGFSQSAPMRMLTGNGYGGRMMR